MQKTRILYLITKSNFGGAQKYVYELATSLDKELFDVSVALGGDGILKSKLENAGIKVISIPSLDNKVGILKEIHVIKFLIKLFKTEKPDVVHLNSSKVSFLGALATRVYKLSTKNYQLKTIFTAHGWAFNEDRSLLSKIFFKILSWITVLLTDKTIAVSNAIKTPLIGWPFVYNKFSVIWNGVKPIEFLDREQARQSLVRIDPRLREDDTIHWIGTTAELHPVKGLDVLINSAKIILEKNENKDVQFIVMGDGQLKEELQKQINDSGLGNNFILMGYVDNASKYLKAFDLFVLPSRSEALALVILEAGLAKIPVVATRVGGIPEVILDKENGLLIEKENEEELARAINEMLNDENKAKNTAEELHKRVNEKFGYERMLRETVGVYR